MCLSLISGGFGRWKVWDWLLSISRGLLWHHLSTGGSWPATMATLATSGQAAAASQHCSEFLDKHWQALMCLWALSSTREHSCFRRRGSVVQFWRLMSPTPSADSRQWYGLFQIVTTSNVDHPNSSRRWHAIYIRHFTLSCPPTFDTSRGTNTVASKTKLA